MWVCSVCMYVSVFCEEEVLMWVCSVCRYVRDGRDKALEECEERVHRLTGDIKAKNEEKKDLEGKRSALTKQLANAKVTVPFHAMF